MILENTARSLEKFANPVSRIADSIGRAILALMVLLITADVIMRYFLDSPIKGSYELIQIMLAMIVFLGLAFMQTQKGHVSITLLTSKLSSSQRAGGKPPLRESSYSSGRTPGLSGNAAIFSRDMRGSTETA